MREKCIVFGCTNEKHQGVFVGDICAPCYKIITEGDLEQPSANFIHILGLQNKMLKDKLETLVQQSLSGSDDKSSSPKSCANCCHKYENRNEPPCYRCYSFEHWEAHDF